MKIVSVNVGLPREVEWRGETVRTSIYKEPVSGSVRVHRLGLEGDQQSDLSVHGGTDKAVYAYPSEHYSLWREELSSMHLPWGTFGENLTTEGLLEDTVHIGDRLRVGSAEFLVTQPRMPCFKLGIRIGSQSFLERFLQSGRSGFYLAVLQEGELAAGDSVEFGGRDEHGVTVADVVSFHSSQAPDHHLLRRVSELPALPKGWRERFRKRLLEPEP
jgi:MOSC domain-containing protein YiiM